MPEVPEEDELYQCCECKKWFHEGWVTRPKFRPDGTPVYTMDKFDNPIHIFEGELTCYDCLP